MKREEVANFLRSIMRTPDAPVVYLWGPVGTGKTSVCKQVSEEEKIGFVRFIFFPDCCINDAEKLCFSRVAVADKGIVCLDLDGEIILGPDGDSNEFLCSLPRSKRVRSLQFFKLAIIKREIGKCSLPRGWRIIIVGDAPLKHLRSALLLSDSFPIGQIKFEV